MAYSFDVLSCSLIWMAPSLLNPTSVLAAILDPDIVGPLSDRHMIYRAAGLLVIASSLNVLIIGNTSKLESLLLLALIGLLLALIV